MRAYGRIREHETERIELGDRVAGSYDEAFSIQRRLVVATGAPLVLMQQIEWQRWAGGAGEAGE